MGNRNLPSEATLGIGSPAAWQFPVRVKCGRTGKLGTAVSHPRNFMGGVNTDRVDVRFDGHAHLSCGVPITDLLTDRSIRSHMVCGRKYEIAASAPGEGWTKFDLPGGARWAGIAGQLVLARGFERCWVWEAPSE